MTIGVLKIELFLSDNRSLKEKRRVLKSLKDRLRNNFNISICEIGHQDKWQMAALVIVCVGNSSKKVNSNLSNILKSICQFKLVEIVNSEIEII
jgi:hypothetical protein